MSIVDDALIEQVRRHHATRSGCALRRHRAAGARRARAAHHRVVDLVHDLLERQMTALRALPFAPGNDKTKYFELLPDDTPLRAPTGRSARCRRDRERARAGDELTRAMVPGSADVNIMTKLDRARAGPRRRRARARAVGRQGSAARVRGVAPRVGPRAVGRDEPDAVRLARAIPGVLPGRPGAHRQGIILKVSDFRSALVQGRFLAKKGIEIKELRIESGLNCGGHLFATDGELLGPILDEVPRSTRRAAGGLRAGRRASTTRSTAMPFVGEPSRRASRCRAASATTVRSGGSASTTAPTGRAGRRRSCSFREATALDDATRAQLAAATPADLYVSDASPLGVPFNNLRGSSSEVWTTGRIDEGHPGSRCPRGYLESNTELTNTPMCTASREYQTAKLASLGFAAPPPADTTDPRVRAVYAKACICHHLGNGALVDLGIARPGLPVAVCPGPNIAWFDREYTLREMVDHVYGRGASLVPASRPHCLAKELEMVVDHFVRRASDIARATQGARSPRHDRREPAPRSRTLSAAGPRAAPTMARTWLRSRSPSRCRSAGSTRPGIFAPPLSRRPRRRDWARPISRLRAR